jgi:hypothetical protein
MGIAGGGIFHGVEKSFPPYGKQGLIFPRNGKTFGDFSTQWKKVFHRVEKSGAAAKRTGAPGGSGGFRGRRGGRRRR